MTDTSLALPRPLRVPRRALVAAVPALAGALIVTLLLVALTSSGASAPVAPARYTAPGHAFSVILPSGWRALAPRDLTSAGGPTAKPTRSFAEAHAAAVSASATPTSVTIASDEVWTPVQGVTSYAKITSGPRTGQYVDLTKGAHHGRAFTIEQR